MNGSDLAAAAHRYADTGWPVFPCQPGTKHPATPHGFQDATTSHQQIDRWWRRTPGANIGIATGAPGPDVLDVDIKPGRSGYTALHQAQHAGLIPAPGAAVRTPSGGAHLYYQGTAQRNGALPARALDFRATGGYVIAPPSISTGHGRRYQVVSHQPAAATVDWAAIRDLLGPQPAHPGPRPAGDRDETVARLARWLETRPEGNRNFPLFYAAKVAATQGLLDASAREELLDASLRSGLRGGEPEARRTLASGERAAAHDPHHPTAADRGRAADRPEPAPGPVPAPDRIRATDPGAELPGREAG
jgi:Bifunctional DNA primase/polymerase, N-terminal